MLFNVNEFIKESESELIKGRANSISELQSQYSQRFPSNCCKEVIERDEPKIFLHCSECSVETNSVMCVPCFLKGNHEGHHVYVLKNCSGCCDCGDPNELKETGYCRDHQPKKDSCNHLTKEEKDVFTKVFTKVGEKFATANSYNLQAIIQWIISFNSFGDEVMNCIISAIEPFIDEELLYDEKFPIILNLLLAISKIDASTDVLFPKLLESYNLLMQIHENNGLLGFAIFKQRSIIKYAETHPDWPELVETLLYNDLAQYESSNTELDTTSERLEFFLNVEGDEENKKKMACYFADYLGKLDNFCKIKRVFGDKADDTGIYPGVAVCCLLNTHMSLAQKMVKYVELSDVLDILMKHIGDISIKCPADADVASNCYLPLFAFVSMIIKHKGESCIEEIIKYGKEKFGDVSEFAKRVIEMPLRHFALLYYAEARKFVRNNDSQLSAINANFSVSLQKCHFIHIFSLVQIFGGMMDKEDFVNDVISHFSVDFEEMVDPLFHFLSCLIFDRNCLLNSTEAFIKSNIFLLLLEGPRPITFLSSFFERNNGEIDDLIRKCCESIKSDSYGIMAKNKSDVFETYYVPWMFVHETTKIITSFTTKNKNSLLPAHEKPSDSTFSCLKLEEIFDTEGFNKMMNIVIQSDSLRLHIYALSVLVEEYKYKGTVESVLSLKGEKGILKDVIESMGDIGEAALSSVGVQKIVQKHDDLEEKKRMRKLKRQQIMDQYKLQMDNFKDELSEEEEVKEEILCPVCQLAKDDIFVYPLTLCYGPDVSFNKTYRINSCMHPMHLSCFKTLSNCPLDRSQLSDYMPALIDVEEITPAIAEEIHKKFDQFEDPIADINMIIFNELHILLSRFEINKDCFNNYPLNMLRNIFLTLKFYMLNDWDDTEERSDFIKELRKMVKGERPFDDLYDILMPEVNDALLCCRLTLLYKYYCLCERKSGKTNFESLLSFDNIKKVFPDKTINDSYVKPFKNTFDVKLPKTFVEFAVEPYNIRMGGEENRLISLLSGKRTTIAILHNNFDVGICVEGRFAGCVLLNEGSRAIILGIPYLNMYNEEDFGFQIGMVTYLKEERLPEIVNKFLAFF